MNRANNATIISIQVNTAVNTMFISYGSSRHSLLSVSELQLSEDNVPTKVEESRKRHLTKRRERIIAITLHKSQKLVVLHHNIDYDHIWSKKLNL